MPDPQTRRGRSQATQRGEPGAERDATPPDEPAISDAERARLRERIDARRGDAAFQRRIDRVLDEERDVLDALDD